MGVHITKEFHINSKSYIAAVTNEGQHPLHCASFSCIPVKHNICQLQLHACLKLLEGQKEGWDSLKHEVCYNVLLRPISLNDLT